MVLFNFTLWQFLRQSKLKIIHLLFLSPSHPPFQEEGELSKLQERVKNYRLSKEWNLIDLSQNIKGLYSNIMMGPISKFH